MWAKVTLAVLFAGFVVAAVRFDPFRDRSLLGTRASDGPHIKLMTWNIGYAGIEDDNRAHNADLRTVANAILKNDPDAVALQELAGPDQLQMLLALLRRRYTGAVCPFGATDRIEAVLVKAADARFDNIKAANKYSV